MNTEQILQAINAQSAILAEISRSLAVIAGSMATAPDIQAPIETYHNFDWSAIGAKILRKDNDGPSVVEWNGKPYKRRAPDNKFEGCIWFSRCTGKDSEGNNNYEVLISFSAINDDVDPIGEKARKLIGQMGAQRAQAPTPPPPPPAPPVNKPAAVPEIGEQQMNAIAQRYVDNDQIDKVQGGYSVMIDTRTAYMVTKPGQHLECSCDRYKTHGGDFRCEHIRAVAIWFKKQNPPKQMTTNGLAIDGLCKQLLAAGITQAEVNERIYNLTGRKAGLLNLTAAEEAKVMTSLNNWVASLESSHRRTA